jgi:flagella basal body P-ring formation protein FlgA
MTIAITGLSQHTHASENANTINTHQLSQAVTHFLYQELEDKHFNKRYSRLQVNVGMVDSRLSLTKCASALNFRVHGSDLQPGRQMIKVQCASPSPWSIYVPATIEAYRSVLVASRSLNRGSLLSPGDIHLEERDVTSIKSFYLHDKTQAMGKNLKRRLKPGQVLTSPMLSPPKIISKGQEVSIEAQSGPVTVRMTGIAMSDGKMGQQIRVKNLRSNKIIRAKVSGDSEVQVIM